MSTGLMLDSTRTRTLILVSMTFASIHGHSCRTKQTLPSHFLAEFTIDLEEI